MEFPRTIANKSVSSFNCRSSCSWCSNCPGKTTGLKQSTIPPDGEDSGSTWSTFQAAYSTCNQQRPSMSASSHCCPAATESANKFPGSGTGPPLPERGGVAGNLILGCTAHTRVSAATDVSEVSRTSLILVTPPRPPRYLLPSWVQYTSVVGWRPLKKSFDIRLASRSKDDSARIQLDIEVI